MLTAIVTAGGAGVRFGGEVVQQRAQAARDSAATREGGGQ